MHFRHPTEAKNKDNKLERFSRLPEILRPVGVEIAVHNGQAELFARKILQKRRKGLRCGSMRVDSAEREFSPFHARGGVDVGSFRDLHLRQVFRSAVRRLLTLRSPSLR